MSIAARAAAGPLLGRNAEVELLTAMLDGIDAAGGALLFRGEPGIGQSRTHLSRAFPRLGITARTELAAALAADGAARP